jgi:uncharacterized Ntn-hydrolase superfamily protein
MTFSVLGYCGATGMVGIAIASSSICVGSDCPWVRPGVGAVTVQYMVDPTIGVDILNVLGSGMSAASAVADVMDGRSHADYRQVAAIDCKGATAHFTGKSVEDINATVEGKSCVASGNVLGTTAVSKAMIDCFEAKTSEHLAERLMGALQAGVEAGGEKDPIHSAALLVVHEQLWPLVNLRVDWSDHRPVETLYDLWSRYEPEMNSYVTWAINPTEA